MMDQMTIGMWAGVFQDLLVLGVIAGGLYALILGAKRARRRDVRDRIAQFERKRNVPGALSALYDKKD